VVICLERGADCLHMVQLMPLHPKTPLSKSRLVLLFWHRLTQVIPEKRPLNGSSVVVLSRLCKVPLQRPHDSVTIISTSVVVVVVTVVSAAGGTAAAD